MDQPVLWFMSRRKQIIEAIVSETSENVIKAEDENTEVPTMVSMLEILAIQAMMNPSSEEVDEELFKLSGKV